MVLLCCAKLGDASVGDGFLLSPWYHCDGGVTHGSDENC